MEGLISSPPGVGRVPLRVSKKELGRNCCSHLGCCSSLSLGYEHPEGDSLITSSPTSGLARVAELLSAESMVAI